MKQTDPLLSHLRHYDTIGLLPPSRIGKNGYRYYDAEALLRLQSSLLCGRWAGARGDCGRPEGLHDHVQALTVHLEELRRERDRLGGRIESVETTTAKLERERRL